VGDPAVRRVLNGVSNYYALAVPRLILLNGPPGCGKSTLATRFADDHPLTLNLDIDRVRDLVGSWRDHPHAAGRLARTAAVAAARAHLAAGHDVVVPQYLGRLDFVTQLAELAESAGADFVELMLWDSKENALRRFAARAASPEPAHRDAAALQERSGGTAELAIMYDRLVTVRAARPATRVVPSIDGDVDETYRALLIALVTP
jgi:predicted kinase